MLPNWLILLSSVFVATGSQEIQATVCSPSHDSELKSFFYTENGNANCPIPWATISYKNNINQTGWAFVDMKVLVGGKDPWKTGYVAGFVEGNATRTLIKMYKKNMIDPFCDGAEDFCSKLYNFLEKNYVYAMNKALEESDPSKADCPYWQKVQMIFGQVKGMIDGYEGFFDLPMTNRQIVTHPIYLMQLFGDLFDLKEKIGYPEKDPRPSNSHCSALIKVLPSQTEILFSHITWTTYASMLRVQKKYSFPVGTPGRTMTFSGYPGSVVSIDDFVITSAKLSILETTVENHNEDLWKLVVPERLLYFVRAQVAHLTAGSGKEWAATFSRENSGTYNNQWLVLDYGKFKKGRPTQKPGLLTMVEQIPGTIVVHDLTDQLMEKTYWPGYNRIYSPELFNATDGPKMVKKYGNWYSYDKCPRALIFARDHQKLEKPGDGLREMWKLMRYNNFKEDPLSRCDCNPPYSAESTIAARSELNSPNGKYNIKDLGFMDQGATDVKITRSDWVEDLRFYGMAGPPGGQYAGVPEFNWDVSILKDTVPHYGQPNTWRFQGCLYDWENGQCDVPI